MSAGKKYLKILVNILIFLVTVLSIIFILPKVLVFFLPFVIGWCIAAVANPLAKFFESKMKIVRKHSSALIIIAALALVILGIYFGVGAIVGEVVDLINDMPEIYANLTEDFGNIGNNVDIISSRLPSSAQNVIQTLKGELGNIVSGIFQNVSAPTVEAAGNIAKNIPSTLIIVVMTILSSYFFIVDRDKVIEFYHKALPVSVTESIDTIVKDFSNLVGGYFKAQFKIMIVVAIILFIGLEILGVPYSILIAILIAFLDLLPVFGTGTVLIPWAVFKLLSSDYRIAIGLLILYGVTQLVRQLIQPKIVGDTIGLNPLATLVFMYVGYKFKGVIGMIIGVPAGMIVINLYERGAFDNIIKCIREILTDIDNFRKIE